MSTMTAKKQRAILAVVAAVVLGIAAAGAARAEVASDKPGAILILPKIAVDTSGALTTGVRFDSEIQITNTSNSVIAARCWIVNATYHCSNAPSIACTPDIVSPPCPTGGRCVAQWTETDFRMTLTKRQPISWKASEGLPSFPCDNTTEPRPQGCTNSNNAQDGTPSFIQPVQEDPFFGELKCVQVNPETFKPTQGFNRDNNFQGDLKGEVTIVTTRDTGALIDARKYNGIAIPAVSAPNDDDTLVLGGPTPEYSGCPSTVIANHMFDGANVVTHGGAQTSRVVTDLTVIPCSENFTLQENDLGGATLQFLVFNEFEQRFSTSFRFTCWDERQLSDIDTRRESTDDAYSIFNVAVQGTLGGQSRIRAVEGTTKANGVLAITEEFWTTGGNTYTTATNTHFAGTRTTKPDLLVMSPELP